MYAQTKVSDENFRQILPGGLFAQPEEKLSYYNLSAGYNVLPGEVFSAATAPSPRQLYLIAGVGSTNRSTKSAQRQTINFGLGIACLLWDRVALQVDLRDTSSRSTCSAATEHAEPRAHRRRDLLLLTESDSMDSP